MANYFPVNFVQISQQNLSTTKNVKEFKLLFENDMFEINMKKTLLLGLIFLTIKLANAQQEWCGASQWMEQQAQESPERAQELAAFISRFEQFGKDYRAGLLDNDSRATENAGIYIPVVFHIVHNGDALGTGENITDAQCFSQIDAMNRHFNGQDPLSASVPAPFQSLVANVGINFCLAKFDPDGNPTTGIMRYQYPNAFWDDQNTIDGTLKPVTIWDNKKYLNIWVVRMGGSLVSTGGGGVLAYATFPGFGPANQDGIVARFNTIGTTGTLLPGVTKGKTVSHEVGHWLGLLHTWGFSAGCGGVGDFIDDTPDQYDQNFGCPTFPKVSCPAAAPNGDMFMNYMDYADDNCSSMFSLGQAARMMNTLNTSRSDIKNSASKCFYSLDAAVLKLQLPIDTICSLSFNPLITIQNAGVSPLTSAKLYYQIDGGAVQVFNWSGFLASQETTNVTLPTQTVLEGTHTFDVSIGTPNNLVSDDFSGNDNLNTLFYAYDAQAEDALPYSQEFEGVFPPGNWNLFNPNNDITWEQTNSAGGYGNSNSSMRINNLGYVSNPNKRRDAMETVAFDLSGINYPELQFDLAYARRDSVRSDSLNVYYSLDCGSNWVKIFGQRGADLATSLDQTTLFVPSPSEWKTVKLPLLNIKGQNRVSFRFENVTGWGNAMYIDNINLSNNQSLNVTKAEKVEVKLYPNPASTMVGVRLPAGHQFNQLSLYNQIGEKLMVQPVNDNTAILTIDKFTNGIYFIQLTGQSITPQTEKLIIAK